jgi:hypothetical protein
VVVAACPAIRGGAEGGYSGLSTATGWTGNGISVSGATAVIRGAASDWILPGWYIWHPQPEGYSILAAASSKVVVSGVTLSSSFAVKKDASSTVLELSQAEPFLELVGGVQPGATATVELTGPSGAAALIVLAPNAGAAHPSGFDGLLWPAGPSLTIVPLVTTGAQPVTLTAVLPATPALEGFTLWMQAAFPGLPGSLDPGKSFLTNAEALLIRL